MRRFFCLTVLISLLTGCIDKPPVIDSIDPRIGNLGEVLTIHGKNFGRDQNESYITIAGAPPTITSYISWHDEAISITVPEFAEPGLIYVHKDGLKSNPALFASRASMPETVYRDEFYNEPRINSIEPRSAAIGAIISIQGSNFGTSRENSSVWFSWDAESAPSAPADHRTQDSVEVFDAEFGYDLWSEREIRVRVPDGAVSGNLEVRTPRGTSRPVYFEITGKPGTKTFRDKRSYTISYAVDIRVNEASVPNALYLWLPRPVSSASQRNTKLLSRNTEPYVENYRGSSLYQFIDLQARATRQITLSYVMDVYAVETNVRQQNIRQGSPVQTIYTMASSLIPKDNETVKPRVTQ